MKHCFRLSRETGGNKSLPSILGAVPGFLKILNAFFRCFGPVSAFPLRVPDFLEGVPGISGLSERCPGFSDTVPGVPVFVALCMFRCS